MVWKCNNPECGKKFPIAGRIIVKKVSGFPNEPYTVEKACCPHCESIDFEEVKS